MRVLLIFIMIVIFILPGCTTAIKPATSTVSRTIEESSGGKTSTFKIRYYPKGTKPTTRPAEVDYD